MSDFTCYRLRITDFDEGVDTDALTTLTVRGPVNVGGVETKLYLSPASFGPPRWASLLESSFDDLSIPSVSGAAALLIARVDGESGPTFLGFVFGGGWQLLKRTAFERGFGLRACLNVVFEGDTGQEDLDPARLRSVSSKRVGHNILRSQHQVSRVAPLEELDIDIRRDLLNGVTGIPIDDDSWGKRVTGKDSLHFSIPRTLDDLSSICGQVLNAGERSDYEIRFSFINDFVSVSDPVTLTRLSVEALGVVQSGGESEIDLAPPDLIDWERTTGFQYHTERLGKPIIRRELRLDHYLTTLSKKGLLTGLTIDRLKSYWIHAVDADGKDINKWSAWHCLFGEIELEGKTYVLDDGDFYQVSENYLASLDSDLADVPEWSKSLPPWPAIDYEDVYNKAVSESSPDFLLLDRKTVRVSDQTTAIEICDLLTSDQSLVHVKRKRDGSASLSHLFAQGLVSAELSVGSPEFRLKASKRIEEEAKIRAKDSGDHGFLSKFAVFAQEAIAASSLEIVYAICADWSTGGLETLPFFSKITLRNTVEELMARGFKVAVKRIELSL